MIVDTCAVSKGESSYLRSKFHRSAQPQKIKNAGVRYVLWLYLEACFSFCTHTGFPSLGDLHSQQAVFRDVHMAEVSRLSHLFILKCWNVLAAARYFSNHSVARIKMLWVALIHSKKAFVVTLINIKQNPPQSHALVTCFVSLVINLSMSYGMLWWLFCKRFIQWQTRAR